MLKRLERKGKTSMVLMVISVFLSTCFCDILYLRGKRNLWENSRGFWVGESLSFLSFEEAVFWTLADFNLVVTIFGNFRSNFLQVFPSLTRGERLDPVVWVSQTLRLLSRGRPSGRA